MVNWPDSKSYTAVNDYCIGDFIGEYQSLQKPLKILNQQDANLLIVPGQMTCNIRTSTT